MCLHCNTLECTAAGRHQILILIEEDEMGRYRRVRARNRADKCFSAVEVGKTVSKGA